MFNTFRVVRFQRQRPYRRRKDDSHREEGIQKEEADIDGYYTTHGGNPKDCRRCYASIRPPCKKCGHALSGEIRDGKSTICEYCFTQQDIKP